MKKVLAIVLTFAAIFAVVGCKKTTKVEAKDGLVVCLASEPASIDPALNSAVDGATLLVHLDSGLYRYIQKADGSLALELDLAKSITKKAKSVTNLEENAEGEFVEVTYENGTEYTVTLKDGIKFSNGNPITSDSFIYSWNRAAGADLAADYCYMFEQICNGYAAECDSKYKLAMTKVSDSVFTFDVMVDCAYMDQLLAFPTYFPVDQATVEKYDTDEDGVWATEANTYVSCGAYILKSWTHNSEIVLEKNPNYWDAANVKLDKITFALADDDNAILASYQSGAYDMIDSVPNDKIDELKAQYPTEFVVAGQMGTYYVSFNVNKGFDKATTEEENAKIRKALGLLIDREYIVKEIGKAGQIPANAFVSAGLSDAAGGEFVDHNGVNGDGTGYYNKGESDTAYAANVQEAIALLQEVGYTYDATTKKFTDFDNGLVYLYNISTGHEQIAKNIQDTFKNYGINITLQSEEWNNFLETRKKGNYNIARNGWVADYDDPSSYLSMWTSQSGNNDCQFGKGIHAQQAVYSADVNRDGIKETGLTWAQSYDVLMDLSNKEADAAKRFKLLHEIEDLLMETGAICPVYYYTDIYMIKDNVKGFFSSPLGYKFFMYCEVK